MGMHPESNYVFELGVRRDFLLLDTVDAIETTPRLQLLRRLKVVFRGEDGEDDGGVSREYFHLMSSQLFSPDFGMFKIYARRFHWFNPGSDEPPATYRTIGTIVTLALYNRVILPIRFPLLLYKKLLGKDIGLIDIAEIDPVMASGLRSIQDMAERGEDVADLGMTFVANVEMIGGAVVEFPLIENGADIPLTNGNVRRYIREMVDWTGNSSVRRQFEAFQDGAQRILGFQHIRMFAPDELDILISGDEVFHWKDFQKYTQYSDGYTNRSMSVRYFWEIFGEFPHEWKLRFLQFATGSDRAPVGGLSNIKMTIQRRSNASKLPAWHTCGFVFGLPDYKNKKVMKKKLELALSETEGFALK
jgi:ubiquitin-protein ligase E3 A